jgi:uncharacterized protein YndB with AHSA1/START domain
VHVITGRGVREMGLRGRGVYTFGVTRASGRVDSASRLIAAPAERIYLAYVTADSLVCWLPPYGMKAQIETFQPRAGGEFRIVLTYEEVEHAAPGKTSEHADVVQGRFLDLVPNQRIVQAVRFESTDPMFDGEMKMTWLLEPTPHGTKVTVTAENVPAGISVEDHEAGFKSTLEKLARFIEQ